MTTSTATYNPSQDGYLTGGNTWDDSGIFLGSAVGFETWIGMVFDFGISSDSERSLALEPPIVYGLSLALGYGHSPANGIIALYFVPDETPANYSTDALRPGYRSEYLLGYSDVSNDAWADGSTATIAVNARSGIAPTSLTDGTVSMNFTLNNGSSAINSSDTRDLVHNWALFRSYMGLGTWDGKIALTLHARTSVDAPVSFRSNEWTSGSTTDPPVLTANQSTFHTGQHGSTGDRRARVRHCPKTGLPGLSDEFVRDGYTGLMVLPDAYDPEDRTGRDFYPPPDEGVVDDEVA